MSEKDPFVFEVNIANNLKGFHKTMKTIFGILKADGYNCSKERDQYLKLAWYKPPDEGYVIKQLRGENKNHLKITLDVSTKDKDWVSLLGTHLHKENLKRRMNNNDIYSICSWIMLEYELEKTKIEWVLEYIVKSIKWSSQKDVFQSAKNQSQRSKW